MALHVYDTLRGKKIPFEPVNPGKVGMYFCGMTVQAPPHMGHMRPYLVADLMRRVFRARGYDVTLIQNFTDIDDKIIVRAADDVLDIDGTRCPLRLPGLQINHYAGRVHPVVQRVCSEATVNESVKACTIFEQESVRASRTF